MNKSDKLYAQYVAILNEELIPAGGCTEPIAIAYAAATVRDTLGGLPERMEVFASGNLIKNAKSVFIPGGEDLRGVDAAAVLGAVGGHAERKLEVLLDMAPDCVEKTRGLLAQDFCKVRILDTDAALHLVIHAEIGADTAEVELKNAHTNIIRITKNGQDLLRADEASATADGLCNHDCLSVRDILDFADSCDLADVEAVLRRQIACNVAIAQEGLKNPWGMSIGQLYQRRGQMLQAYAAAASDARMSGCTLPVVIVSGSGNQGATASLPVLEFAREHGEDEERTLRALVLSDLLAVHLKTGIGRLSAYCGAVCAATGSGCAMTYLAGGTPEQVEMTLTNSLATASGIFCDGAKPSCAAKIAASVECAVLGHQLAMENRSFLPGEGIVMGTAEETIRAVGTVASQGMNTTDQVILKLMTQ